MDTNHTTEAAAMIRAETYTILGTSIRVYAALEPATIDRMGGSHTTISHEAGNGWPTGRVGTRRLPAEIEAMPRGEARYAAVRAFQEAEYARAYDAILAAYPEAASGHRDMGEIRTYGA